MKNPIKKLFCKHYFSTWLYDYQPLYYAGPMCFWFGPLRSRWECTDCGRIYSCKNPKFKGNEESIQT